MRFAMTARTLARDETEGREPTEMTTRNIQKVTRYRANGDSELSSMVDKIKNLEMGDRSTSSVEKRWGGAV